MPSPPEIPRLNDTEEVFQARPFTPACGRLVERGEHALIGISAGNGYFSQHRIAQLLEWTGRRFGAVDLLYADLHIDTMHRAAGAEQAQASRRACRSLRDVRRRIRRAMEAVRVPARVRCLALSETVDTPGYRSADERVERAMREHPAVERACEDHVRRIIAPEPDPDGARFRAGLSYLRAELPFLLNTPEVLSVDTSVCCYHDLLPVLVGLRRETSCLHPGQGHLVLKPLTTPSN